MATDEKSTELERTQELFEFLRGTVPDDCKIEYSHVPKLSPDQAWTVIWYLGNQYWQVPDFIERCDVCGDLFDSEREGECLDYGEAPYHFCDTCRDGDECNAKREKDPDKSTVEE